MLNDRQANDVRRNDTRPFAVCQFAECGLIIIIRNLYSAIMPLGGYRGETAVGE